MALPSAGKPSLARRGSQLAEAYRVQVGLASFSSVPFKDQESEGPAEFVRLQQERCLWQRQLCLARTSLDITALSLPSVHSRTSCNAPSESGPRSSCYVRILYPDPKETGVLYRAVLPTAH